MWLLNIKIKEENKTDLKKVLDDISAKDDDFNHWFDGNTAVIENKDKDQAFRRGMWLKKKASKIENPTKGSINQVIDFEVTHV